MRLRDVFPVVVSILVIIVVAMVQKQSKLMAAITATMPMNAPLALWIVYSSSDGDPGSVTEFSLGMLLGILPTGGFLATVWLASRAGLRLVPMIALGYCAWGASLGAIMLLRRALVM